MNITQDDPTLVRFVRNMVTVVVVTTTIAEKPFTNFSATVIWFRGSRWLVTAAHCARTIEAHANGGTLIFWGLGDAWKNEKSGQGQITGLPLEYGNRWVILSADDSYDVAVLDLGLNIASMLEAGKVIAVPEAEWMNPPAAFDFYALVGTPNEMVVHNGRVETELSGKEHYWLPTGYDIKRAVVNLENTSRPKDWADFSHARFYGKILTDAAKPGNKIEDIVGASGGPIFGCVNTADGYSHHLIAIQSAWQKSIKCVEADYLTLLPEFFDREIRRQQ